jgi:membrane fusion protein (multidrug efflux system)
MWRPILTGDWTIMLAAARSSIRVSSIAALLALAGCGAAAPPPPPPPSVDVITVSSQPIANVIELPARVQAVRTAEVRARVDGIVERRLYEEGTDVPAGRALFRIDPSQNQAAYDAARAALNRAEAAATNTSRVVARYRPLVEQQAISSQEYDAAVAAQRQAQADVASARADLDRARLNLEYSVVSSPIAGRAGRAQVTEGALVSASQATLMTTVEQLDPVYVNFSQSSSELLAIRRNIAAGQMHLGPMNRVAVKLELEDGTPYGPVGHLDFLDMAVDESTGTVSLRAEVPNPARLLLPGQFVRAQIIGGTIATGLLVPQRAVMLTAEGANVFVVGKRNIATLRPVRLGDLQGGQWVVREGLRPGERIIVNGLQKVRPGAPVRIDHMPSRPPRPRA